MPVRQAASAKSKRCQQGAELNQARAYNDQSVTGKVVY